MNFTNRYLISLKDCTATINMKVLAWD